MRATCIPGMLLATAIAAGCGSETTQTGTANSGGSSTGTSQGGSGGNTGGGGSTGGGNTGGNSTGGGNTGGDTGGSNSGGSNTGGGTTTSTCTPLTEDASKVGADCGPSNGCPAGYTCHEFAGFALQRYCAILCDEDCQCPSGTTCTMKSDKSKTWKECIGP